MDGTEARGIRTVEERPDQCADTRVSLRGRTVVPRHRRKRCRNGSGARKRAGNDWPRWEDISPESREAKVLWRQWERLYLVGGVLHRRFHELEGQGWRPQLVVRADRRSSLLQRFHGGAIGAHMGTARTLAMAEQDMQRMRLRNAKETTGTAGTITSIHRRGPDGTLGDGCRRALPHHLDRKLILPHGGMLLCEMA